ncbi:MAG: Glycerol-3-phosphate dehydrogenase [NAD(P)+] [Parcubacteria group bacterium GW2011_GWA2_49_9]|nr:MAG: Glycerol-3-phosphate dehydrogenase [NAD(P)+] [Parcubacteria group bacterium GW2011_GWA2_49_9]
MTHVAIIGAGAIGQALAHILDRNKENRLELFDKDPAKVTRAALPLPDVVKEAEVLFLCVPSWAMRGALTEMKSYLSQDAIVVSLAKGIEEEHKKTMDALLVEILPQHRIALLGGPMLAAEFMEDLPGVGCLATEHVEVAEQIAGLFAGTLLSFETTSDVRGVAFAGVLKNIYALGLGVAHGLSWGDNQKGWYLTRALVEMATIVEQLGGKRETAYSLAGIGDLVATGFSGYSRNSRSGEEIVRNGVCNIQSEGCASLPHFLKLLPADRSVFPLLHGLEQIIIDGKDAKDIFSQLIR